MRAKNKVVKYGVTIGIIVIVLGGFFYWKNNRIIVTKMLFENSKIPRIQFIGGMLAKNRSLFPKYISGIHSVNNTSIKC